MTFQSTTNKQAAICPKCGKPKEKYDEEYKRFFPVYCDCQLKEIKEFEEEQQQLKSAKLFECSRLGNKYKDVTFETTDLTNVDNSFVQAFKRCERYCNGFTEVLKRGLGIYIYGNDVGCGKTHLGACIINRLIQQEQYCLSVTFNDIVDAIFEKKYSTLLDKVLNYSLVLFDDIGTEIVNKNGTDTWLQEKVFHYINSRYINKLPTIFTANHSLSDLGKEKGYMKKTLDRIYEMSTAKLEIKGKSYRLRKKENDVF